MSSKKKERRAFLGFLSASRLVIPIGFAGLVGVGTGLIAVSFIRAIEGCRGLFFDKLGGFLWFLGPYSLILIPALGGLLVGPIVTWFAPEAKGHGVPEVMKAMTLQGGKIRPVVVLGKAIASALAIGSGASVGREGPIVQVGSAFGSMLGQVFKWNESRVKNLVACGAAAGISAVFNAPIAGVMFSLEVILRDFSARSLSTVVIASVASSVISRIFLGESPAFTAPAYSLISTSEIFLYGILGVLSALAALLFVATLSKSEEIFDHWSFPPWLKPAIGGLAVGGIGLYFPQIFGTGLPTIEDSLHGDMGLTLLFFLVFAKIFATSLSLGSGSSGGVFAPALFIGAVLGGAFGHLLHGRLPFSIAPPGAYALVGMASVFAGAAHAPVTAILIVFEMTGDYRMILPIMVSVVIATTLSQWIQRESIYTLRLKKSGVDIDSLGEARVLGALQVRDAMTRDFETLSQQMMAKEVVERMSKSKCRNFFVVNSEGETLGIIKPELIQEVLFDKGMGLILADDLSTPLREVCFPDEHLGDVAHLMRAHDLRMIPVVDPANPKRVIGVLESDGIFRAYSDVVVQRAELMSRLEQEETARGTVQIRFTVPTRSPASGKKIRELDIPDGVVLTSIERRGKTVLPEGDTVLQGGDRVWAVLMPYREEEFRQWLEKQGFNKSPFWV